MSNFRIEVLRAFLQAMRTALESFDIELIGLADIDSELPSINENGKTPLENAEIKAMRKKPDEKILDYFVIRWKD